MALRTKNHFLTLNNNNMIVHNITETQAALNYPYGSLKCTKYYSVDFSEKHGFRISETTTNPKAGHRLNKPHKGTYYDFACLYTDPASGYIKSWGWGFNDYDSVPRLVKFLAEHSAALQLTPEMIETICLKVWHKVKVNLGWTPEPAKSEMTAVFEEPLQILFKGFKSKAIDWTAVCIDAGKIAQIRASQRDRENNTPYVPPTSEPVLLT